MFAIFDILAVPLGYVMRWIYTLIPDYFATLFVFVLLFKLLLFPLGLKSQKSQADRARLQPKLDRIMKKYGQDRQKMQQKQMELYEKENVSMTGGCAPMLIQMVLLFGVIAVIYKPLTFLHQIPADVITAGQTAVTVVEEPKEATEEEIAAIQQANKNKLAATEMQGYYGEIRMLSRLEQNKEDVLAEIGKLDESVLGDKTAQQYYDQMLAAREDFIYGDLSLLEQPWDSNKAFGGISLLWLIPLLSGLTALASTLLSMRYTKALTAPKDGEKQPGQGCTNGAMYFMPLFSVYISFIVPCGVGIYWIFSNLLALVQTYVLNQIYNPAKIRAEAEAEYLERRRKKAEEKKRLAESRKREQRENALAEKAAKPAETKPREKKLTAEQRNRLAEKEAAEAQSAREEAAAEPAEAQDAQGEAAAEPADE